MPLILLLLSLYCCGIRAAFVVSHVGRPLRRNPSPLADQNHHLSSSPLLLTRQRLTSSLSSSTSNDTESKTSTMRTKEMALQLLQENAMPPTNNNNNGDDSLLHESSDDVDKNNANHPLGNYDEEHKTPLESEFISLMSTFLTYTERDIQSLTSTSTRYHHLHDTSQMQHTKKKKKRPSSSSSSSRQRSKEEGIRYRALYSGVQAASLEPEVLRSFTVLFEDYLPIRLAGRRIYAYLENLMEEVREERRGEIAMVREFCPIWDQRADDTDPMEDFLECARDVWDVIMDEALLLDDTLESVGESQQSQEGGVVSLSQMIRLGIDQVLVEEGIVNDAKELECIARQVVLDEDEEMEKQYDEECGTYLKITFPVFMNMLNQCTLQNKTQNVNYGKMLQNVEQKVKDQRAGSRTNNQDTSTMLAAKAVHSGSSTSCEKRQKYSDSYDGYVSTFQLWERKFLGNGDAASNVEPPSSTRQSRRMEILRGCFCGARNPKVAAALKIVYMDYAALRLAGDLIFKLMSKIAK